jgi:hypothetical protein
MSDRAACQGGFAGYGVGSAAGFEVTEHESGGAARPSPEGVLLFNDLIDGRGIGTRHTNEEVVQAHYHRRDYPGGESESATPDAGKLSLHCNILCS